MPMPQDRSDPTSSLPVQPLPQERAFLLQLAIDAVPAAGTVRGRAVHIRSGEAVPFESIDELLRFLDLQVRPAPARGQDETGV